MHRFSPRVVPLLTVLGAGISADACRNAATHESPGTGDERRNYYRITSVGMRVAREEAHRLELLTRVARLGGLLPKGIK
jgi:hypothetical protein